MYRSGGVEFSLRLLLLIVSPLLLPRVVSLLLLPLLPRKAIICAERSLRAAANRLRALCIPSIPKTDAPPTAGVSNLLNRSTRCTFSSDLLMDCLPVYAPLRGPAGLPAGAEEEYEPLAGGLPTGTEAGAERTEVAYEPLVVDAALKPRVKAEADDDDDVDDSTEAGAAVVLLDGPSLSVVGSADRFMMGRSPVALGSNLIGATPSGNMPLEGPADSRRVTLSCSSVA